MLSETRLGKLLKPMVYDTNNLAVSIPMTHANRLLASIALNKFPSDHKRAFATVRRYQPMAEKLTKSMTLKEFARLKGDIFSLVSAQSEAELISQTADYEVIPGEAIPGPSQDSAWMKNKDNWLDAIHWLIDLSSALRIIPPEHIKYIRSHPTYGNRNWTHLEGYWPMSDRYRRPHQTLQSLVTDLDNLRWNGIGAGRVGLIIGDFRIGTHKAHIELLRKAKEAVGINGQLVVVTPSRKTILRTTCKEKVWPDEHRLVVLNTNPYIDQLLMVNMPEKYYPHPERFWQGVWAAVSPDFIFLGEKDHPLQPAYEMQCKYLGGILLIDDVPVTVRSADLL